jgi:hypothetical protein
VFRVAAVTPGGRSLRMVNCMLQNKLERNKLHQLRLDIDEADEL